MPLNISKKYFLLLLKEKSRLLEWERYEGLIYKKPNSKKIIDKIRILFSAQLLDDFVVLITFIFDVDKSFMPFKANHIITTEVHNKISRTESRLVFRSKSSSKKDSEMIYLLSKRIYLNCCERYREIKIDHAKIIKPDFTMHAESAEAVFNKLLVELEKDLYTL